MVVWIENKHVFVSHLREWIVGVDDGAQELCMFGILTVLNDSRLLLLMVGWKRSESFSMCGASSMMAALLLGQEHGDSRRSTVPAGGWCRLNASFRLILECETLADRIEPTLEVNLRVDAVIQCVLLV